MTGWVLCRRLWSSREGGEGEGGEGRVQRYDFDGGLGCYWGGGGVGSAGQKAS